MHRYLLVLLASCNGLVHINGKDPTAPAAQPAANEPTGNGPVAAAEEPDAPLPPGTKITRGDDYDCHGNDGYGQLGKFAQQQYFFGNLKQPASGTSPCMDINQKLGLSGDKQITCQIVSAAGKPASADWDAFYIDDWTKNGRERRECSRPDDFCGGFTTNMSGLTYLDGSYAMRPGFPFKCKECAAEFAAKVKAIDCRLDATNTDHKNHLVLEGNHLVIKAAPHFDGNSATLDGDIDRIFPSVPQYFARTGYAR